MIRPRFKHLENRKELHDGTPLGLSVGSYNVHDRNVNARQATGSDRVKAKETTACTLGFISQRLLLGVVFLVSIFAELALSGCEQKTETTEPAATPAATSPPSATSAPTAGSRGVDDEDGVPKFPWPPPKASASDTIPRELIVDNAAHPLLGTVERAIESAFQQAGYGEKSYYSVPGGFAMASRMEQMNQDGSSKGSADRWSLEVPRLSTFSLSLYLTALFRGRPGYYRVIVFVVTSQPFSQSSAKITSEDAAVWVSNGVNKLPEKIANQEYSPAHTCTALIYEFKRPEGQRAQLMDPSEITGSIHLERSGLMAAFRKLR
jgi:hypothetical protein